MKKPADYGHIDNFLSKEVIFLDFIVDKCRRMIYNKSTNVNERSL